MILSKVTDAFSCLRFCTVCDLSELYIFLAYASNRSAIERCRVPKRRLGSENRSVEIFSCFFFMKVVPDKNDFSDLTGGISNFSWHCLLDLQMFYSKFEVLRSVTRHTSSHCYIVYFLPLVGKV